MSLAGGRQRGNERVALKLIALGADVDAINSEGDVSVLTYALLTPDNDNDANGVSLVSAVIAAQEAHMQRCGRRTVLRDQISIHTVELLRVDVCLVSFPRDCCV